jgi:hypothetical protein
MRFLYRDLAGQKITATVRHITNGAPCRYSQCNHTGSQDTFHVRNTLAFANCRKGDRDDAQDHDPRASPLSQRSGPERSRHRCTQVQLWWSLFIGRGVPHRWDVVISQSTDGRYSPEGRMGWAGEFVTMATNLLEWE